MRLTLNEICRPLPWRAFRQFFDAVESQIGETDESKRLFRLASGAYKVWRDEVVPLVYFCERVGVPDAAILAVLADGGPTDATISGWRNTSERICIQITCAIDGQDERLRMELLTEDGSAPASGPIRREGRGARAKVIAEPEAISHLDIAQNFMELVRKAIERTSSKEYQPGMWLLVNAIQILAVSDEVVNGVLSQCTACAAQSPFERVDLLIPLRDGVGAFRIESRRLK